LLKAVDEILCGNDHFGADQRGMREGIKKTCRFNTNRLIIENGLSNFYKNANPFLNVISTILSNPVYTISLSFRIKITML